MITKIFEFIKARQSETALAAAMVLIAIISFQSGKISALKSFNKPLVIKASSAKVIHTQGSTLRSVTDSQIVASKNSAVYHFLWCSGAQRIKEGNKITFASEQEAQSRGYSLASNCKK